MKRDVWIELAYDVIGGIALGAGMYAVIWWGLAL